MLYTSIHDAASRNRYIYYPDHLVRLPGPQPGAGLLVNMISNVLPLFTEPALKGILLAAMTEAFRPPRDKSVEDESVGDFVSRRFGKDVADNLASAVFHGIYAGDIYKLSAKTLLPHFWRNEIASGGIFRALFDPKKTVRVPYDMYHEQRITGKERGLDWIKTVTKKLKGASVFAMKGGMQQLVDGLGSSLSQLPNVEIKTNSRITHIGRQDAALEVRFIPIFTVTFNAYTKLLHR